MTRTTDEQIAEWRLGLAEIAFTEDADMAATILDALVAERADKAEMDCHGELLRTVQSWAAWFAAESAWRFGTIWQCECGQHWRYGVCWLSPNFSVKEWMKCDRSLLPESK